LKAKIAVEGRDIRSQERFGKVPLILKQGNRYPWMGDNVGYIHQLKQFPERALIAFSHGAIRTRVGLKKLPDMVPAGKSAKEDE
jgi:hypothetical protein